MDIQAQVQTLIDETPDDQTLQAGIKVVAVVLGQIAQGLGHTQYYVLQNLQQQWQVTTLQNRTNSDLQKTVLYAYGHLADATRMGRTADLIAIPIPIVQLLFQFFSFDQVESILFMDEANTLDQVRELQRQDLQSLVHNALQANVLDSTDSSNSETQIA
jgi:hypothetical protein